jgi:hypothetical protein
MIVVTVTPYIRPRNPSAQWSSEFETVPSKNAVQKRLCEVIDDLNAGLTDGRLEATEETRFFLDTLYPLCLKVLQTGTMPKYVEGKMAISTPVSESKSIGSIAIR